MSELKVGDNVFYKGDEGIIREVMMNGKENFYRVDVSKKSIHYLYENELDLVTQKLNDNQKIVLNHLKKDKKYRPFRSVGFLDYSNGIIHDRPSKELYEAYKQLDYDQQFEVLEAFAQWGLE
ncbi:hypothetical protein ACGWJW_002758 [Enterococcus hirae]